MYSYKRDHVRAADRFRIACQQTKALHIQHVSFGFLGGD